MMEVYGICGECGEEELLNVRGGLCYQCWSNLDYLEHELEMLKTEETEEETEETEELPGEEGGDEMEAPEGGEI